MKTFNQIFMTRMFLQIASNEWEQKQSVPDTYYTNSNYENVINVVKII